MLQLKTKQAGLSTPQPLLHSKSLAKSKHHTLVMLNELAEVKEMHNVTNSIKMSTSLNDIQVWGKHSFQFKYQKICASQTVLLEM